MSSVFTNEYLDGLRSKADPPLDDLINSAAKQLDGIKTMVALFKRAIESPELTHAELEEMLEENLITSDIVDFFAHHDSVPDEPWVNPSLIHDGGEFYRDRGVMGFLTLACASLPACYCWTDEAYLLGTTGRLERKDEVPRRLPETARFVLDVATKSSFKPKGIAIHASHKIRLMHSIIRYLVISKEAAIAKGHYNPIIRERMSKETDTVLGHNWSAERGAPISQELLIGTLLTFHYVVLNGYDRMGVHVTDAEKEAYLHRWNVVGYFLGIDQRVLASLNTMEEAKCMFDLIMERNRNASEDAALLEQALLDYMQNNIIDRVLGGKANPMIIVPYILTRQLSGKATSQAISLKLGLFGFILKYPVWWGMKFVGHLSNLSWARKMTNKLMGYVAKTVWNWRVAPQGSHKMELVASTEKGSRQPIMLHPSLAKEWDISK